MFHVTATFLQDGGKRKNYKTRDLQSRELAGCFSGRSGRACTVPADRDWLINHMPQSEPPWRGHRRHLAQAF